MVKTDLIEGILDLRAALVVGGFYQSFQDVLYCQHIVFPTIRDYCSGKNVCRGKDGSKIVCERERWFVCDYKAQRWYIVA